MPKSHGLLTNGGGPNADNNNCLISQPAEKLSIALVSDFFCPNAGGVETHIYHLAKQLLKNGHKVIMITHAYGKRNGIVRLSTGLKVYYLPFLVIGNCYLPSVAGSVYWFRRILLYEQISVVHLHSSFSTLAHEALLHAWCLGLPTVFTDHSLFGFSDAHAILLNKLVFRFSLPIANRFICVSHTSKENTVLRAGIVPGKVFVIPNAIEFGLFTPDPEQFYATNLCPQNPTTTTTTTIVVMSRLVYRKGVDLLVEVIPEVCARHPSARFLIGGDGPKRVELEEMRDRHSLHSRVQMLGTIPHNRVREVLVRGQIFLNTSLTEAFCMGIVEAASCGLFVVSTRVGGIPEVLPPEFTSLTDPIPGELADALLAAIAERENGGLMCPIERHEAVKQMYSWEDVAARTEVVYRTAMLDPDVPVRKRFANFLASGLFGLVWIFFAAMDLIFLGLLDWADCREKYRQDKPSSPAKSSSPSVALANGRTGSYSGKTEEAAANMANGQWKPSTGPISERKLWKLKNK